MRIVLIWTGLLKSEMFSENFKCVQSGLFWWLQENDFILLHFCWHEFFFIVHLTGWYLDITGDAVELQFFPSKERKNNWLNTHQIFSKKKRITDKNFSIESMLEEFTPVPKMKYEF